MKLKKKDSKFALIGEVDCPYDQEYVEWATGGPDRAHVKMGGTCMRADIYLNNDECCNGCHYYKYCLCAQKKIK